MSVNWPPQMPAIKTWLNQSSDRLSNIEIESSRLDAEIILADVLDVNRTYLHSHSEDIIKTPNLKKANKMIRLRTARLPIAYIIGHKEFYKRDFIVTKSTLIPRPESEMIVDLLKKVLEDNDKPLNLIDVGTGSGCLGITAKLEFPNLNVTLSDISNRALKIAAMNAAKLSANVNILKSNLLNNYDHKLDIILANLPYVDKLWERSPETNYEPPLALFAENNGKKLIEKLLKQSQKILNYGGYIIIEADPAQHKDLISFAQANSLKIVLNQDYIMVFKYQS
ncbi:MAG: release factor glutamine methyltransferase [Patescibacteria group bacterium]|nr:release factor glutamine methyltransferase [Patescibacteria group bacterium]